METKRSGRSLVGDLAHEEGLADQSLQHIHRLVDGAAGHGQIIANRLAQVVAGRQPGLHDTGTPDLKQGVVPQVAMMVGEKPGDAETAQKGSPGLEGLQDGPIEETAGPWRLMDHVTVDWIQAGEFGHPECRWGFPVLQDPAAPPSPHLAGQRIQRHGELERGSIADIHMVGAAFQEDPDGGVDVRLAHVGAVQRRVVAKLPQEPDEKRIGAVAGPAQVVEFDAVQEFG